MPPEKDYRLVVLPKYLIFVIPPLARTYTCTPWSASVRADELIDEMLREGLLEPDTGYISFIYEEMRDGWRMIAVRASKEGAWQPCP